MKYPLSLGCNDKLSCPFKNCVYVSDLCVFVELASDSALQGHEMGLGY